MQGYFEFKVFRILFSVGGITGLKSKQLALQNSKKIKDTRSMTSGHISRFISDNLFKFFLNK